jgi:glycosyltransferase involved in cell wall biosynthesis
MSSTLVSVVMPCFNAGRMLRSALRSVIAQTHSDLEIIFVDNNSRDGSLDVARAVAMETDRPVTITRCEAQGANHARNWGYGLANGDYIQWLDADDTLHPDKIGLQVAALERDRSSAIAYGDWSIHRALPGAPPVDQHFELSQVDDQVQRTLAGIWYPPHLYLLRRDAAQKLQAMRAWWPDRELIDDVEYSLMAAFLGMRFRYVAGAHVTYNIWSQSQASGSTDYTRRTANLTAAYQRMQRLAESGEIEIALSHRHRIMLNQGWDIWRIAQDLEIRRLPGRRFRLHHRPSGRETEIRPREAAIARGMLSQPAALTSWHHAVRLARSVPEVANDHPFIIETLQRLQRDGFLDRVAQTAVTPASR